MKLSENESIRKLFMSEQRFHLKFIKRAGITLLFCSTCYHPLLDGWVGFGWQRQSGILGMSLEQGWPQVWRHRLGLLWN